MLPPTMTPLDGSRHRARYGRLALTIVFMVVWIGSGVAQPRGALSMLTYYQRPEPVPMGDLIAGRHDLLLIVAIVNPVGPTVYGLDVLQRSGRPSPEFVSFSLNPFDAWARAHATVARATTRAQLAQLVTESGQDFGVLGAGQPTLIFPNGQIDDAFRQILRHKLSHTPDVFRTLDRLRRYPLRSFDRIAEEMNGGAAIIAGRGAQPAPMPARALNATELTEYIEILTRPAHMRDELESFAMAWSGAIQFQMDHGNVTLARSAMSWQALVPVLTAMTSPKNQRR